MSRFWKKNEWIITGRSSPTCLWLMRVMLPSATAPALPCLPAFTPAISRNSSRYSFFWGKNVWKKMKTCEKRNKSDCDSPYLPCWKGTQFYHLFYAAKKFEKNVPCFMQKQTLRYLIRKIKFALLTSNCGQFMDMLTPWVLDHHLRSFSWSALFTVW